MVDRRVPFLLACLAVLSYIVIYGLVGISRVNHFDGVSGYDLSIPDQGLWLMSNLKNPFSTVRGLHLFGDHTPYIYILFVPLYWLHNNIDTLLALHAFALGVGGIGVYLIAREVLKKEKPGLFETWSPFLFTLIYLTYPALNYLNMELLFSESFAVPFLIFAFYFALKGRYGLYIAASALAMLCKEDAAVTVFMLGLYVAWKHSRKYGLAVCAAAAVWFVFNMYVLLPYFNGFGYFRHLYGYNAMGRLGHSPKEALAIIETNPNILKEILATNDNANYVRDMFAPLLFLPIIGFDVLLICLPAFGVNLMSGYYYTHYIKYHYTAYLIPFVIIASIYGVRRITRYKVKAGRHKISLGVAVMFVLTAAALSSNQYIGGDLNAVKNPEGVRHIIENIDTYTDHERDMLDAVSSIPANASVSASYNLLTHLSHMERVYMFYSPFRPAYWGINGENLPNEKPDYLLLDEALVSGETKKVYDALVENRTYAPAANKGGILTLRKNEP